MPSRHPAGGLNSYPEFAGVSQFLAASASRPARWIQAAELIMRRRMLGSNWTTVFEFVDRIVQIA